MEHVEYRGVKYYVKIEDNRLILSSLGINNIFEIKGLEKLVNLEELYLGGNKITEIKNLDTLVNLRRLRLGGNHITEIKGLKALTNLISLRLSGNKISEIKGLNTLKNLASLKLNSNNIIEIKGLDNLENLQNLHLKDNPIRQDEFFLLYRSAQEVVKYCQEKIISLFVGEENDYIEHKETFRWDIEKERKNKILKSELSKAACALLNCKGGKIFIGVNDSGEIKGIKQDLSTYDKDDTRKARDLLFQDIKNTMREDLGTMVINSIEITFKTVYGLEIAILDLKPSQEPIYHLKKDFRIRNGPASPKLEGKELGDYIYTHFCRSQNIVEHNKALPDNETKNKNKEIQRKCIDSLHTLCSYLYGIEVGHYDEDSSMIISSLHLLRTYKDLILPLGITYWEKPTKIIREFRVKEGIKIFIHVDCKRSLVIKLDLFQFKVVKIHKHQIDGRDFQDFKEVSKILECIHKRIV